MRALLLLAIVPNASFAQAPGVPVYSEGPNAKPMAGIRAQARQLRAANELLSMNNFATQLARKFCTLNLPPVQTAKLDSRELWQRARNAHVRIGWHYLCKECNKWHTDLSGGYAITSSAVATCAHVVGDGKDADMREGYLIAVDEDDHVIPVLELLAISRATDTAIVKLKTNQLQPLPLSTDVFPGDPVVCFSDPLDRRGVYSNGIVERFMRRRFLQRAELTKTERKHPERIETPIWVQVSTEWAQGSSGSAVLDFCGNAIGHVSEIQTMLDDSDSGLDALDDSPEKPADTPALKPEAKSAADANAETTPEPPGTVIVFHDAITAKQVRALIQP